MEDTSEELSEEKIVQLRNELFKWSLDQDIPKACTYKDTLMKFLVGCKYDIDKAKRKMLNYQKLRITMTEWYSNRDPLLPEVDQPLSLGMFVPLPNKGPDQCCIIIIRPCICKTMPLLTLYKAFLMVYNLVMAFEDSVTRHGVHMIVDLTGMSLKFVFQYSPLLLKKTIAILQDCFPIRIKSIHFVNCSSFIHIPMTLLVPFLSEKLRKRVRVHGKEFDDLHNHLNLNCLPDDYGGTDGSIAAHAKVWKDKLHSNRQLFLDELV